MTRPVLLIAVLACDYQQTPEGKQDGQTLGPHSLTRLNRAITLAVASSSTHRPIFVFSAGRLKPEHQRLCDLQAEYVRQAGFPDSVVPLIGKEVWGSQAELAYATTVVRSVLFQHVRLAVVTEDYHMYPRTDRLIAEVCDAALPFAAERIVADSQPSPPSRGERVHEWLWLLLRLLPPAWRRRLTARRRAALAARTE